MGSSSLTLTELRDFEPDDHQEIEVDEGNTAVIECHLPESQPKAQVRYSVKQEWLETSKGTSRPPSLPLLSSPIQSHRSVISWNTQIPLSVKPAIRAFIGNVETWESSCLFFNRFASKSPGREGRLQWVCGWYAEDAWGL